MLELIIAMGIMVVLSMLVVTYANQGFNTNINIETGKLVQVMHEARQKSISGVGDQAWGVRFAANSYTLFPTTYNNCPTNCQVHTLPTGVTLSTIAVTGSEVIFARVTGAALSTGTIIVSDAQQIPTTRTVQILATGEVGENTGVAPLNTRDTDSRHINLDLGFNFHAKTTLVFNFANVPDVSVNIADFMNGTGTQFDYEGNNSTLGLRLVTLENGTVLSVLRDSRFANQPFSVVVDGTEIVSYNASFAAEVEAPGVEIVIL